MVDFFATLPAPLPLMILETFEDLPSLAHLLQASPAAAATFDRNYVHILDLVISQYSSELQKILRFIIIARSEDYRPGIYLHKFDEFVHGDLNVDCTTSGFGSLSTAQTLIKDAARIQGLSRHYLESRLARIYSIKPSYQVDPSYRYYKHYLRSSEKKLPEARPYTPVKSGPPSWVEEQRILRALWRLQIYNDIIENGGAETDERLLTIRTQGPEKLWDQLADWELLEMSWLYDFLLKINAGTESPFHLSGFPLPNRWPVAAPAPYPGSKKVFPTYGTVQEDLNHRSAGANLIARRLKISPDSPLHRYDMKPLYDLGLGIWDDERLALLGLHSYAHEDRRVDDPRFQSEALALMVSECGLRKNDSFTRWNSVYHSQPAPNSP